MTASSPVQSALLRGREHLGIELSESVHLQQGAIAISAGGAAKTYPHTEPNEDAALLVEGPAGSLLAVADGHHGAAGAQALLEGLALQTRWISDDPGLHSTADWEEDLVAALLEQNRAILELATRSGGPPSPTTLSLAIARPEDDLLVHAAIGDSHLFVVRSEQLDDLGWHSPSRQRRTFFLGTRKETPKSLVSKMKLGCRPLSDAQAIVLATDGLSEVGIGVSDPARVVRDAFRAAAFDPAQEGAQVITKGVLAAAMNAQRQNRAGDNIAIAVVRLGA